MPPINDRPASPPSPLLNQALQDLDQFEKSPKPGVWSHLDKSQIIKSVRSRLFNPFKLNQGQQPFCGPASIVFELIRKQPERYVQICRDLFETGQFAAKTQTIRAPEGLRRSNIGEMKISQVDWMLLATLRESENLIFSVEPDAPEIVRNLGGMTKSWEMKGWVREILGYPIVDYHHAYLLGDLKAFGRATEAIAQGGVAFMLITANGLLKGEAFPTKRDSRIARPLAVPDHWITLTGNSTLQRGSFWNLDSGHVGFDVYSWASLIRVDVNRGVFRRFFWGVVVGRAPVDVT